jgi:hypothetical protein
MTARRGIGVSLLQFFCVLAGLGIAFGAMDLPEKLKDVPLYPGSKIVQTMDMGANSMVMLQVKADRDAVLEFYKKDFKGKGWKVAFQAEQEDSALIHFTKNNEMVQVNVQHGDEGDEGMVNYQIVSAVGD